MYHPIRRSLSTRGRTGFRSFAHRCHVDPNGLMYLTDKNAGLNILQLKAEREAPDAKIKQIQVSKKENNQMNSKLLVTSAVLALTAALTSNAFAAGAQSRDRG